MLTFTLTGSQWEVLILSFAETTGIQRGKQLTLGYTGFVESELFALWELVGLGGRRVGRPTSVWRVTSDGSFVLPGRAVRCVCVCGGGIACSAQTPASSSRSPTADPHEFLSRALTE